MIPLKDLNPQRSFPIVTLLLIVANVVVFVHQITLPATAADAFIKTYALTPSHIQLALEGHRYTPLEAFLTLFTCMFLHGGFLHIIGNMWFLWIFGGNVEDQFGHIGYLLFYLVCGLGSGVTQVLFSWGSRVPSLGASGAIAGVLGAYIVFFPRARILKVGGSNAHLGKSTGDALLRVEFRTEAGLVDSAAWLVHDLPTWLAELRSASDPDPGPT